MILDWTYGVIKKTLEKIKKKPLKRKLDYFVFEHYETLEPKFKPGELDNLPKDRQEKILHKLLNPPLVKTGNLVLQVFDEDLGMVENVVLKKSFMQGSWHND